MKAFLEALCCAIQFLTRIPLPSALRCEADTAGRTLVLFPAVGWLLGTVFICLGLLLHKAAGCGPLAAAVIIITAETILTGAFHLDGLADTFDAFLSPGTTREAKLSIMKDSRIGVMGASALVLAVVLKAALLAELLAGGSMLALLFYPVVGRWTQVVFYACSPYVRPGGIGTLFAGAADRSVLAGATILLAPCFLLMNIVLPMLALAFFLVGYRFYIHSHIGGITGDILGSATVLSEIVFLGGLVLLRV